MDQCAAARDAAGLDQRGRSAAGLVRHRDLHGRRGRGADQPAAHARRGRVARADGRAADGSEQRRRDERGGQRGLCGRDWERVGERFRQQRAGRQADGISGDERDQQRAVQLLYRHGVRRDDRHGVPRRLGRERKQ